MYHELDAPIGFETRHVTTGSLHSTFLNSVAPFPHLAQKGFPWRVGCILGPSGSGKSSNLKLFEGTAFDGFCFVLFCFVVFQQIWWSHGINDLSKLFNLFSTSICFGKLFRFIWERARPLMVHLFWFSIQYQLHREKDTWRYEKPHDYGNHEVACLFVHRHSYQVIRL